MSIVFIEILKKVGPYLKYVVFGAAIVTLLFLWRTKSSQLSKLDQAMDLYKRQTSGQLTEKERQLEAANNALGLAQSQLMEQSKLAKAYQEDGIKTNKEFDDFKKQYNLQIESYNRTIAKLEEKIKGGTTTIGGVEPRPATEPQPNVPGSDHVIDPKTQILPYDWQSDDKRFHLSDPDIFVSGNETFTLNQNFRITGEIYKQKNGFLKTQRLTLEEVVLDGVNADGTPKYKIANTANVVDSHFNYTVEAPDTWVPHKSVFGVWGVVSGSFALNNGLNPRFMLGTGLEFLQWRGLGLGLQLYLDATVWQDSGFGISVSYRPTIKSTQLNLGISLGLATQFRQPFQSYIPMGGLIFYLW